MKTFMMMLAMSRGREAGMALRIGSVAFVLLVSLLIVLAGVITGELLWLVLGGIWTVIFGIVLVIMIVYNIRKNTPRW